MKTASEFVHTVSVSGKLIETPRFLNKVNMLERNYESIMNFLLGLGKYERINDKDIFGSDRFIWKDIPASEVAWLVREFLADPMYLKFNADSLADYIEKMTYLQKWDVVIPEGERSNKQPIALTNESNIFGKTFSDTGRGANA